jgi:hypothetical protein
MKLAAYWERGRERLSKVDGPARPWARETGGILNGFDRTGVILLASGVMAYRLLLLRVAEAL